MKGAEQKQPKRKEIDKIRRKKVNAGVASPSPGPRILLMS